MEDLPRAHQTLHLLSKCVKQSAEEIRQFLPEWIEKHEDWCRKVSKKFLKKRDRTYAQFVREFLHPAFPLDLLAIGIFARAYKKHIAIFYNHKYWCTDINQDLNKCHVFLEYCGRLNFQSTRRMHSWEYNNCRDIILQYKKILATEEAEESSFDASEESDISDECTSSRRPVIESDDETSNANIMMNLSTGSVPNQESSVGDVTKVGNIMQNSSTSSVGDVTNLGNIMQNSSTSSAADVTNLGNIMQNSSTSSAADVPIQNPSVNQDASVTGYFPNQESSVADVPNLVGNIMQNSSKSSAPDVPIQHTSVNIMLTNDEGREVDTSLVRDFVDPALGDDLMGNEELDLENVMETGQLPAKKHRSATDKNKSKAKCVKEKPIRISKRVKSLKLKQKTIENFKKLTPPKVMQPRKTQNSLKTKYSQVVGKIVNKSKMSKPSLPVPIFDMQPLVSFAKKRKSIFKCHLCKIRKDSASALQKHMREHHPEFKYKCKYKRCVKQFQTKNALYRHNMAHKGVRFFCNRCDKGFVWGHQLRDHKKSHTGRNLYECAFPPCDKSYSTKRACQRHEFLKHSGDKVFKCESFFSDEETQCSSSFSSTQQLNQHKQGFHGSGFKTRCGQKSYRWPYMRVNHQKECDECIEMKRKRIPSA